MLVLGSSEGHTGCMIYVMNTDLVVIPGGMTSQLLVLANNHFRHYLKQLYSEWLLAGDYVLTPAGTIRKPSVELLWIKIVATDVSCSGR
jgi:hypothetical protein